MKAKMWLALLSVYIFWGSTYLAIRFAVESLPPFLMAATRFLAAGGVLYVAVRLSGGAPRPTRKHWLTAGVMGLFLLLGGNGLVSWAEIRIPSGITALMIGATPLWIVLVDALRPGGVRPTRRTLAGVLIGFAGIAWLISPSDLFGGGERIDLVGALALVLASLSWAIGSVYGRERHNELPAPLLATSLEMLVGGAALVVVGTLLGEWGRVDLAAVSTRSLLGLGYLIVFGSLVAYSAYTWLLRVAPTPLVSTYAYVNPLVAVFMGYIFASEPLTPRVLGAAVIILSSVVLINTTRPAKTTGAATSPAGPGRRDGSLARSAGEGD
jgi:drug/metabolite transporter (DMT)-like permease